MGLGEEGIGLRALDILDAQTQVVALVDSRWMHLLRLGPPNYSVATVQLLLLIISPLVLGPKWIGGASGLEYAIFVDVLYSQPLYTLSLPSQLRWTATLDGLSQNFLPPILPRVTPLAIDVADLESVSDEVPAIIRHDLGR